MKRLAALGAIAGLTLLAGCATDDGYYSGGYGYGGGYTPYAYGYGPDYVPYYDDFGYPYTYGPSFGLGFGYYDYGGWGGHRGRADLRQWRGSGGNWMGRSGMGRPSSPPPNVGPQGLGPQAVAPQAPSSGTAVAPSGGRANTFMGRRRGPG